MPGFGPRERTDAPREGQDRNGREAGRRAMPTTGFNSTAIRPIPPSGRPPLCTNSRPSAERRSPNPNAGPLMRSILLTLPIVLVAARLDLPSTTCAEAALAAAPDTWSAETALTGDLTLDGRTDILFWRPDSASVLVYVVACDGDLVLKTWRMRIPVDEQIAPAQATVELASLLIDEGLVQQACRPGKEDQCEHVRRENRLRQALADAGGRAIRIRGPSWSGWRLFWSAEMAGFVRIAG